MKDAFIGQTIEKFICQAYVYASFCLEAHIVAQHPCIERGEGKVLSLIPKTRRAASQPMRIAQ
jgi:hypothetical protein